MTVRIGGVELGAGRPKVCVPLTGSTIEALVAEAGAIRAEVADLVELRIDRFRDLGTPAAVDEALGAVRSQLDPALPILVTCRSAREGGGADLRPTASEDLAGAVARHPATAAVDVEMDLPGELASRAVELVHAQGLPVVMSFHDLQGTPSRAQIVDRLVRQQQRGADVVKLACTPSSTEDVLTLLAATLEYTRREGARPAITMAMGSLGAVSRLTGEAFGSALTFGTVGAASAPGQLDAARLRDALDLLHTAR